MRAPRSSSQLKPPERPVNRGQDQRQCPSISSDAIVIGVDARKDVHLAVAINGLGARLGFSAIPATTDGRRQLADWARGHRPVHAFGIEGTGSYGADLSRALIADGGGAIEVRRANRCRRRCGRTPWRRPACERIPHPRRHRPHATRYATPRIRQPQNRAGKVASRDPALSQTPYRPRNLPPSLPIAASRICRKSALTDTGTSTPRWKRSSRPSRPG